MRIKVSNLKPNPFRKTSKYPIDRDKVNALKTSIKETSFWDNILVRKNNGHYEIGYGHHRLVALKELKVKTVDLPVRNLDDATMLRIMANENMDVWGSSPAVINETVLAAKQFLDAELAKGWNDSDKNIRVLFNSKHALEQAMRKDSGVGRDTILKFLGGNWKAWMVQSALDTLKEAKENVVDRKAVEVFPKLEQANEFKKAVKAAKIPVRSQVGLAKQLKHDEVSSRNIRSRVNEFVTSPKGRKLKDAKPLPMLDDYVRNAVSSMSKTEVYLKRIKGNLANVQNPIILDEFRIAGNDLRQIVLAVFPQKGGK